MKNCIQCERSLADKMFYRGRATCKACYKKQVSRYRKANREKVAAYQRRRPMMKKRARAAVASAVASGKLVKPSVCGSCETLSETEGHHEDYSKPLEVNWLCTRCHTKRHRRLFRMKKELIEWVSSLSVDDLPASPFKIPVGTGHNGQPCFFTINNKRTYMHALKSELEYVMDLDPRDISNYNDRVMRLKEFLDTQVKKPTSMFEV